MKQYYMPTKVIMGENCVQESTSILKEFGKKAMIVTGRNSAKVCGALEDVTGVLDSNEQQYVIYDKVVNNPTVECVYEGGTLAKEEKVDFIVAIGGGSPMDAAKVMALLALNDVPKEEIFNGVTGMGALPMIHIPTTAGTGSEVTPYAILTNTAKETKTSVAAPSLFPKYALLDERYLEKLPHASMVHTVIDSLSHSMEGMLSVRASEITDAMAVRGISLIGKCLDRLKNNTLSKEDRKNLLLASALGGMVIASTGTTIVHSMGYSLTYFHGADHGRANGLVLPEFLKVAQISHSEKVRTMLDAMGLATVEALDEQIRALLGERETLTMKQIEKYTNLAKGSKNIPNCIVPITEAEIREIFQKSLG